MGYFSWEVLSKKKSVAVGYGQRGNLSFWDRMQTLLKLIAAAWLAVAAAAAQEETVQVRLQQGVIEGARSEAAGGRFFYTFRSIPFAKPPVGKLRFKNPVAAETWPGVRNGSLVAPKCPQVSLRTGVPTHKGSEDCLYLTVYTPRPHESALPVMVWLHGGGFTQGTSEDYPALPLLTKDVVLVTVQYRLGTLGFFSTEDSEALGNFGLRDQALALRWVQDNIRSLGGDPSKVTLFGESTGGASVHFHILSPLSEGLFQRAIMQSGTTLCPWMVREGHKQVATKMSEIFNCSAVDENSSSSLDSAALVACLRDVPLDKLIVETLYLSNGPQVMVPRVDGEFVPDHPAVLLREGRFNKVDIISGVTQHEGALASIPYLANPPALDCLYQHFGENGPVSFGIEAWEDDPEYLARRAFHHYLGPLEVTEEKANEFTQLFTDALFTMCHLNAVKHHLLEGGPDNRVFTYELQHRGEHSTFDDFYPPSNMSKDWVFHGDDLQYLFYKKNQSLTKGEDLFVSRIMVDLWTNFAASGHPTPDLALGFKWEPMTSAEESYLAITSSPSMEAFENQQVQEFWRNMPMKTNKLLYPDRFLPMP